jgi:GxxExxY protein
MSHLVEDATGNDLTYRIIGAAMTVHNAIGPGYKEEVYERALAAELNQRSIFTSCQHPVEVFNADRLVALFYLDLFVEGVVVVEVKAFSHQLTNDERAQVINYLKATGAPVGLLFNFGRRKLEYKRIFPGRNLETPVQRTGRDHVRKSDLPDVEK